MSRYHVRCTNKKCYVRRVLNKHPDFYKRLPKCTGCGERRYTIDKWMQERDTKRVGCHCAGYKWEGNMRGAFHRRGSKSCWYRADGTQRFPGDPDFYDEDFLEAGQTGADEPVGEGDGQADPDQLAHEQYREPETEAGG